MPDVARETVQKALAELFSGYRAEWLKEQIFSLFTEPSYFPQLVTPHPCFLVGGRGTGKTTALKCLSYEGQSAIQGTGSVQDWPYYGMYYRVNTNRVNAFRGPELPGHKWDQLFAHYVNLELTAVALRFLEWFGSQVQTPPKLPADALKSIAASLHLGEASTHGELIRSLETSRLQFEAAINNVGDRHPLPPLSMQGAPVDQLFREIRRLPGFEKKSFFFLVDEYENFDQSQQRIVNTLIKHCGELYSFKVGVREFGMRTKLTVNEYEQLMHPADYKLIHITD